MHVTSYGDLRAFKTLDGSEIREWAGSVSAQGLQRGAIDAVPAVCMRARLQRRGHLPDRV